MPKSAVATVASPRALTVHLQAKGAGKTFCGRATDARWKPKSTSKVACLCTLCKRIKALSS